MIYSCMQDIRFDRQGQVYYQEYVYFAPHPDSCSDLSAESAATNGGYRGADSDLPPSEQIPQCFETDEVVTLNLPLVGVLKAIDTYARPIRHLVDLAVNQFFFTHRDTGKFKGLFMRRCVARNSVVVLCSML
jgi:hypothetical protein